MKDSIPFQPGTRVAAYLRDSGHEEQELSIEQQEAALRAWCQAHDLRLTRMFIDAASPGSTTVGREAFREMIAHFHAPDCREAGIILWKYNRFARDIDDAQFYRADLRRRGYIIHSLNDSVPSGLDGRFFEAAIDWMNARYLDDLSADVKRGLQHIMATYGALGGTPPRGFKRQAFEIGTHRDGRPRIVSRWVPDPDLVDRVRRAFELRAAGASLRHIQRETQLYKNINGWSGFFRNRLYIGEMVFSGKVYPGYCEPIVSREIWEAVQKRNRRKLSKTMDAEDHKTHPRRSASRFLLSGILVCAECGAPMNAALSTVHKRNRHYHYDYYACSRAGRNQECSAGRIPRLLVEKSVLDHLADYILEPHNVQQLMDDLNRDRELNQAALATQREHVLRKIASLRRKIENLVDALAEGNVQSKSIREKLARLEDEELRLVEELDNLTPKTQKTRDLETVTGVLKTVRALQADQNTHQLREVLLGLIDRIEIRRDGDTVQGTIYYYSPVVSMDECPRSGLIYTHNFTIQIQVRRMKMLAQRVPQKPPPTVDPVP